MSYIQLVGGAYQDRSIIAAAQRCLNLYPENVPNTAGEPIPYIHLPTPGLTLVATNPNDICRCLYTASNGDLWSVWGNDVYYIAPDWSFEHIGTLTPTSLDDAVTRTTPVSIVDNGLDVVISDGSSSGWYAKLDRSVLLPPPHAVKRLAPIETGPYTAWTGSNRLDFSDSFFIAAKPNTNVFYVSSSEYVPSIVLDSIVIVNGGGGYKVDDVLTIPNSGGASLLVKTIGGAGVITGVTVADQGTVTTAAIPPNPIFATGGSGVNAEFDITWTQWDTNDVAAKNAKPDNLQAIIVEQRVLWLLGTQTYEIWFNSGGSGAGALSNNNFPYEAFPGAFGDRGLAAIYSLARTNNHIYWLSQDTSGRGIFMQGTGNNAKRISTYAIENEISRYETISDCVAWSYQQQGHVFIVWSFVRADKTWVFDATSEQWHERCYIDENGHEHRILANTGTSAYGHVVCGDWRNGNLYIVDINNYTDNFQPIKRLRSFPHQIDLEGNRRVFYQKLIANMAVGNAQDTTQFQTVIDCDFTADDGTLLQAYNNPANIGAIFTKTGTDNASIFNDAVIGATNANASYRASGVPTERNYPVSFDVFPTNYGSIPNVGSNVFLIGRADVSGNGYKAEVVSDGTQYNLELVVMPSGSPTVVALGTIPYGVWSITLTMTGQVISVAVQRTSDGHWLNSSGSWVGSQTTAISISDTTYTGPGRVLIGGIWA